MICLPKLGRQGAQESCNRQIFYEESRKDDTQ